MAVLMPLPRAASSGLGRVTGVARKCHLGFVDSRTVEFAPENDRSVMNWLRSGRSAGRMSPCLVEVNENTGVLAVSVGPEEVGWVLGTEFGTGW